MVTIVAFILERTVLVLYRLLLKYFQMLTDKMAQQEKVVATKPDHLNLSTKTHTEGEN